MNNTSPKIRIEDAVGLRLAHDITEVRPGEYKGPSFRRGHKVRNEDLCHLMRLGKRHLYQLDTDLNRIHEDEAVLELATALAGPGVTFGHTPQEGKLQLKAAYDGLLKVKCEPLIDFNMIPDVMCASMHNNTPVKKGACLAGTRAIPLVIDRAVLDRAVLTARTHAPVFSVKLFNPLKSKLIITGNEIYDGLIEDRFESVVGDKLGAYGLALSESVILPDDEARIANQIQTYLEDGTELIITTGGMSVDPDDVTRESIRRAGADPMFYSAAVLPGAMFLLAYKGNTPIVGMPACGLFHPITIFDLILPRLLAGEKPDNRDLAQLAPGGLCLNCPTCHFPNCSFGKSG